MDERRIRRYGSQSARWDAEFWQYHHAIVGYLEYHCLTLLRDHLELPILPMNRMMRYWRH